MPKKILVLVSNPKGTPNLEVLPEIRELREALQRSQYRESFALTWQIARYEKDLRRYILDVKPQILHFCGHGAKHGLMLEDDTGTAKVVSNEVLIELLRHFSDFIECVVLNACHSAVLAEHLVQHFNYVIGMQREVLDAAAIAFVEGFYDALGAGEDYKQAFNIGQSAVFAKMNSRVEGSRKAEVINEGRDPANVRVQEHLVPVLKVNPNLIDTNPLNQYLALDSGVKSEKEEIGNDFQKISETVQPEAQKPSHSYSKRVPTRFFEFESVKIVFVQEPGMFGLRHVFRCTPQVNKAYGFVLGLGKDLTIEMIEIPGGEFLMGSKENEPNRLPVEGPQHLVRISPFFMSKYPITQEQWQSIAESFPQENIELHPNPSRFQGGHRPVDQVSWHEAVEFCKRLENFYNIKYRLPSEAEWEYACRANTSGPFCYGETLTPDLANYNGKAVYGRGPKGKNRQETTIVESFPANNFGLCDMHGNLLEWCSDPWHPNYNDAPNDGRVWMNDIDDDDTCPRVLRGGAWGFSPHNCRSASRFNHPPRYKYFNTGFRIALSIYEPTLEA